MSNEKPRILTKAEVAETVHEDNYVWVEIRAGNYWCPEDETFHLRVHMINDFDCDFSSVGYLISCKMDEYGRTWRIWDALPDWENSEVWES